MSTDITQTHSVNAPLFLTIVASGIAHVMGWMPFLTTVVGLLSGLLGSVWFVLCIFENASVKAWRSERSARKKLKRISALKNEERIIAAELAMLEPRNAMRDAAVAALDHQVTSMPQDDKTN